MEVKFIPWKALLKTWSMWHYSFIHLLHVWTKCKATGGLPLIFEGQGHSLYFSWKFKERGVSGFWRWRSSCGGDASLLAQLDGVGLVSVFQNKSVMCWKRWHRIVFTGNLDEDFPGTRNCRDVRFCLSVTLEIASEPEAASKIIVVAQ